MMWRGVARDARGSTNPPGKEVTSMQRRFQRDTEAGARNDAALEEVRRLFERYRAHPRPVAQRSLTRKTDASRRDAEAHVECQTKIHAVGRYSETVRS
jgi:ferric-dicitrate binding protein FerR (iron transport regulator)